MDYTIEALYPMLLRAAMKSEANCSAMVAEHQFVLSTYVHIYSGIHGEYQTCAKVYIMLNVFDITTSMPAPVNDVRALVGRWRITKPYVQVTSHIRRTLVFGCGVISICTTYIPLYMNPFFANW